MGSGGWIQKHRWGMALGGSMTILIGALFALGVWDRLDEAGLDWHFRHCGRIEADPRIVLIDIDDRALATVDSYPWPRRRYAQLIETLSELGATQIVLDLVFPEPSQPRIEHAGLSKHYDLDAGLPVRGDPRQDPPIFDDDELAKAMAQAGNVYVGMHFGGTLPPADRGRDPFPPETAIDKALALIRNEPAMTPEQLAKRMNLPPHRDPERFYWETRLVAALLDDFSLDTPALANRLTPAASAHVNIIEEHLPAAKRLAARHALKQFRQEFPQGDWPSFFRWVIPRASFEKLTPDREELLWAFHLHEAELAVRAKAPECDSSLRGRVVEEFDVRPPIAKFAKAAGGVGFVSLERTHSAAVVREIPLVAVAEGRLYLQLGLLVAGDILDIDFSTIRHEGDLVFGKGEAARRFPLNDDGSTLVNWHSPRRAGQWHDSFTHIPAARVMEIPLHREDMADNQRRLGLAVAELVALRHEETPAEYQQYERRVNERLRLEKAMKESPNADGRRAQRLAELEHQTKVVEEDAHVWLRRMASLWASAQPATDAERAQKVMVERFMQELDENRLADALRGANEKLEERTAALIRELEARIRGRICLVGYTASAVADLVPTPISSAMPGVMAHANVMNMILQNEPVRRAAFWANGLLFLGCGLLTTFVTIARRPFFSLLSMLVVVVALLAGGALSFRLAAVHTASVVAALTAAMVWAAVTLYRQLIAERGRRQFQRALAQYTSPAIAHRIAESRGTESLVPQPAVVSCFFSDLVGFTRLSERLGPERTRDVLNPYLSAMTSVLIEQNALVSKFMGDGVFAFFNSPLWPCPDHARAACAGALAAQEALGDLNRRGLLPGEHFTLAMRIGLSTGAAFVGDYGSDTKLDYTCIGDTVNLASRLEKANRVLGTGILVDEASQKAVGDEFAFRALGLFHVAGRSMPVEIFELVAHGGQVDAQARAFLDCFQEALACFQHCQWEPSRRLFEECRRMQPQDPLVRRYLAEIEKRRQSTWADTMGPPEALSLEQPALGEEGADEGAFYRPQLK